MIDEYHVLKVKENLYEQVLNKCNKEPDEETFNVLFEFHIYAMKEMFNSILKLEDEIKQLKENRMVH